MTDFDSAVGKAVWLLGEAESSGHLSREYADSRMALADRWIALAKILKEGKHD